MAPKTFVIVNPKSRGGRHERGRRALERALRARLERFDLETTRGPNDAARLARDAALSGAERIVVAGGDGTANEAVSGLLAASIGDAVEVAFLPLGTGRDLARGLGIGAGLRAALDVVVGGETRRIDAGRVRFLQGGGKPCEAHFVNVASVGFSAAIVENVDSNAKARWGPLAFAAGFAKTLRAWAPLPLEVRVDGEVAVHGALDLVAVANGRFFGGGMRLAPDACFEDGLFDLVAVRAMSRAKWVRRMPRVYRGAHIALDEVLATRGRVVEVACGGTPEPQIELDGEARGRATARFDVLPSALRVRVPKAR